MAKDLINSLENDLPSFEYEANEPFVLVKHEFNGYEIDFLVWYDTKVENYIPATYDDPEEFDLVFLFYKITDIEAYEGEECLDLSEEQIEQINNILTGHFNN